MLLKTLARKMANSGISARVSDVRSVASGVRLRVRLPLAAAMLPLAIYLEPGSEFFTTQPVGKGTGLGLSVSYGIVQAPGTH